MQANYQKNELPKVREKIQQFKEEQGLWGICARLGYLIEQQADLELQLLWDDLDYKSQCKAEKPYMQRALIFLRMEREQVELKKIRGEIKHLGNKINKIPQQIDADAIQAARDYPVGDLIELKKGKACCPFHAEKTPSFSVKDNHGHCFGCGKNADSIELYMHLQGVNFIEAVKYLSGR